MKFCMFLYRCSHFFYTHHLSFLGKFFQGLNRLFFSNGISGRASIDKSVKFPHGGMGVLLHDKTIIGKDTTIHCGVKIVGTPGKDGAAVVGRNVIVGANTVLIGPVTIGDNVIIGASSVVTKDLPSNCVAFGNPARVMKENSNV